jgi:HD-GYP domain-containing protein (c-di-GMP phosphodiesterase class II)
MSGLMQQPPPQPRRQPGLAAEIAVMRSVHEELAAGRPLPVLDVTAVSYALCAVTVRRGRTDPLPQLALPSMSDYPSVHAVNAALLAIAVAEENGYPAAALQPIALAALLHDIGMAFLPADLLTKAEQLDAPERKLMMTHPVLGARAIIASGAPLELAAVVAAEHHLRIDDTGYPKLTYPRPPHPVSRLVQVCDTFHALRSARPFREAWPHEVVLSFLQQRAGFEFDPEPVSALVRLLNRVGDPWGRPG